MNGVSVHFGLRQGRKPARRSTAYRYEAQRRVPDYGWVQAVGVQEPPVSIDELDAYTPIMAYQQSVTASCDPTAH